MSEQEKLTQALSQEKAASTLRGTLQQYGIPASVPLVVSFKMGDKAVETAKLSGSSVSVSATKSDKDIVTAVKESLNQVDGVGEIIDSMATKEGREPMTVTFKYGDKLDGEISVRAAWCCPCPNNPNKICCFC